LIANYPILTFFAVCLLAKLNWLVAKQSCVYTHDETDRMLYKIYILLPVV